MSTTERVFEVAEPGRLERRPGAERGQQQFTFDDLPKPWTPPAAPPSKRVVDVAGSIAILVVLAPVLLLTALAVAVTSRGPVFYRQRRVGLGGEGFDMWKFRSMRIDAEEILERDDDLRAMWEENDFKLPENCDPRLTPIGRFIRKTSLDELPQLFNVLTGRMSLVGPRPVRFEELPRYGERVPGRSSVGFPERADIDESYVRSMSLRRDVGLLLRTIPAVLRGDGAH